VVDSADVLADPAGTLSALCLALGIGWEPAMLAWPAGIHPDDGIWASHWYDAVAASTAFQPADNRPVTLDDQGRAVAEACQPDYDHLARHRIRATVA
jgi:hypothetical protein